MKQCAICNGPLAKPPVGRWYVIRVSMAMQSDPAKRDLLRRLRNRWDEVQIFGDQDISMLVELHVCSECYTDKLTALAMAVNAEGN